MEVLPGAIGRGRPAAYLGLACGALYSVGSPVTDTLTASLD